VKLDEKLVEVIEQAQKLGNDAFLFGKEQVPEVVEQLLRWKLVEALIYGACFLPLIISGIMLWRLAGKIEDSDEKGTAFFIGLILNALGCLGAVSKVLIALQIYIAPKVFLIEYAARLMK